MKERFQGQRRLVVRLAAIAMLVGQAASSQAATREFVIDPDLSILTASGNLYGEPYQEQGAGSFSTKWSGTILLNVGQGGVANVEFLAGSMMIAENSGDWQPLPGMFDGTAPANYGAFTDDIDSSTQAPLKYYLATRELSLSLQSAPIQIGPGFDVGLIDFSVSTGHTDWSLYAAGSPYLQGNATLVGNVATNAMAHGTFNVATMTIPIDISVPIDGNGNGTIDSLFRLTGEIVAKANIKSYGDLNEDGNVDGADFVIWQTNFPSFGLNWIADANGDGNVDGADFVIWQTNFPFTGFSTETPTAVVPEPSAGLLSLIALATMAICRKFRRRPQGLSLI